MKADAYKAARDYLNAHGSGASAPVGKKAAEALEVEEWETIQGIKIASSVLEADIWLVLDRSFVPHDGLACYYPEEIPLFKGKTREQLREIQKVKLEFPGCRVIQDGAEG